MSQEAESRFYEEQKKYDYLQYVIPDQNNIPRGKVVNGRFKEKFAKEGWETANVICMNGPNCEFAFSIFDVYGHDMPNEELRPCLETLTPWPWVGREGRRVGNVLCDLYHFDGKPDLSSPRQLMKAQLDTLRRDHGLVLKTAFEYEFGVYKEGTLEPLGGNRLWCYNLRHWARHQDLFCDLTDLLKAMGLEISSLMSEFPPGQWEITTEPEEGVRGGDVCFYVKNAVKGFFETRGYTATFMAKPTVENMAAGLHLNHSLWSLGEGEEGKEGGDDGGDNGTKNKSGDVKNDNKIITDAGNARRIGRKDANYGTDSTVTEPSNAHQSDDRNSATATDSTTQGDQNTGSPNVRGARNVMLDETDPDKMSKTARHWLAGLLHHAPALTALCSPTLNCYRRLFSGPTPSKIAWGVDDRRGVFRVHNAKNNVYIENRLASAPCSPYLAIAGTVAAGLDGLKRELDLPEAGVAGKSEDLPKTLADALDALEKDEELRSLLGERFVQVYLKAKREYEVQRYLAANLDTEEKQMEFERNMYFESM